jgi:hypothetical protein
LLTSDYLLNFRSKEPELFATPTKGFELEVDEEAGEEFDEEDDNECEDEQFNECASAASWMDVDGLSAYGDALQSAIENSSDGDYSDASESSPRVDVTKGPDDDMDLKKIFMDMQVRSPISVLE